ncbi:interleukin-13 receptor subunit alpha-2 [Triplophysa dalaica]|uniref:interleukin-13 receptor subunit alpha-2 n=1 Tax=Triplophysa dalaica TaxID=1582913 RepID=UPI0024DF5541|nr:interleukin-13 receptor subunit alpha-2 [Triplophysa dalaica]
MNLYHHMTMTLPRNILLLNKGFAWLAAVMIVLLTQKAASTSAVMACGVSVDPPASIQITDPGNLGYLTIQWAQPASLRNLTDCKLRYQLRYYDTYEERWRIIRTHKLSYSAQFDLEKPIKIRIVTLMKCTCTNGTEVQGEEADREYTPDLTGVEGSRIREFHCVFHGKEYMDCTWESGPVQPPNSQHYLYYWHREMDETKECPEYIILNEVRRGCRFPHQSLLEFTQFNMCVNGSSAAGSLRAAFFSLEVQNYVKPGAVSSLQMLETDELLRLDWVPPSGLVPDHCLEYEVESNVMMKDGKEKELRKLFEETSGDFQKDGESKFTCFRVRSKMSMYCADQGLWSDWSPTTCTASGEETQYIPSWHLLNMVLGITFVVFFILCLSLWILKKLCRKKDVIYTLYKQEINETFPTALSPIFQ